MKNTITRPILKALSSFLISIVFALLFLSCNGQSNGSATLNKAEELSIPTLEELDLEPRAHYKTLGMLSPLADQGHKDLDAIKFPNKALEHILEILSPAYLTRNEIDSLIQLMRPPANSSPQTRAELDFLLKLQEERTPEQVDDALRMHPIGYFPLDGMKNEEHLFFEAYEIFGPQFNREIYPKTEMLLHHIMREMRITEFTAKNYFLRARPRQLESNLEPLKRMSSSSYASGHTLWAYMQAYIMGTLIPEKKK